jgi:hypothetical protein
MEPAVEPECWPAAPPTITSVHHWQVSSMQNTRTAEGAAALPGPAFMAATQSHGTASAKHALARFAA